MTIIIHSGTLAPPDICVRAYINIYVHESVLGSWGISEEAPTRVHTHCSRTHRLTSLYILVGIPLHGVFWGLVVDKRILGFLVRQQGLGGSCT